VIAAARFCRAGRRAKLSKSMPTFVIHAIGQPSKKITIDKGPIRVGRDPGNQLVLGDKTVSREHARFETDLARRWYVACVSETNPVVVDGKMVTKRKYVAEGAEILVGKEHLVIFCANDATAARHLGETVVKTSCKKCDWAGTLRTAARDPVCPDCGSRDLLAENAYAKEREIENAKEGATSLMSPGQLGQILGRLKAAKRSHLERADGHAPARKDLSETEALQLGARDETGLKLFGLMLGRGVKIAWDGTQFVAESAMWFPGMKVNGTRAKAAPLKHGDIIRVGANRFRFSID
jgi:pSer/pThr/pTyr-binding forkhead associated (FHA) protein